MECRCRCIKLYGRVATNSADNVANCWVDLDLTSPLASKYMQSQVVHIVDFIPKLHNSVPPSFLDCSCLKVDLKNITIAGTFFPFPRHH